MRTIKFYIDAYLGARRAGIGTAAQSAVERTGYYLMVSAGDTPDGEASPSRAISRALLADAGGNKSEAARTLGISRPRLDRMVDRYDLTVN